MKINVLRGAIYEQYTTQKDFARALDWHINKLSLLMNGKYIPKITDVELIVQKLNLSNDKIKEIFFE